MTQCEHLSIRASETGAKCIVCIEAKLAAAEARVKELEEELAATEEVAKEFCDRSENLGKRYDQLREALQKIAEPMKYHHWEEDPYTRAACFQFVADEALKHTR